MIRYLSLFSGIEAASAAWHDLDFEPVAFSEIDAFPCAVLAHHYPHVTNLGDIRKIDGEKLHGTVDLIVGGSPCQDFSISGPRAGLSGERSGLVREFVRVLSEVRPRWFIWENVPGVLSCGGGQHFRTILNAFDESWYCCAWRILDAQYFGVAQRRRRVFVVGYSGDWRPCAKVLFESESLCGNIAQSGEAGNKVAGKAASCAGCRGSRSELDYVPPIIEQAITCKWAKGYSGPAGDEHHNLVTYSAPLCPTLRCGGPPIGSQGMLTEKHSSLVCLKDRRVRRITPLECERLMGFPDGYTDIQFRGKPASDAARYKALGNSMCTNVMLWLGERILKIENPRRPIQRGLTQDKGA